MAQKLKKTKAAKETPKRETKALKAKVKTAAKPSALIKPKPSKPKITKEIPKVQVEKSKAPRVEVIKKADVLKRKAEEAAKEALLKAQMPPPPPAEPVRKVETPRRVESQPHRAEPSRAKATIQDLPVQRISTETRLASPLKPAQIKPEEPKLSPKKEPIKTEAPKAVPVIEAPKPPKAETAEPISEEPAVVLGPPQKVKVSFPVTVGELAPKLSKTPNELIKILMQKGIMMTINQRLDEEAAKKIALDFNVELSVVDPLELATEAKEEQEDPSKLRPRPPVVTVMGHVDHGKTSLLDAIRKTNVMASEFGGITQRIGAYQVELNGRKITFLDTPGHEAFTAMRARGTKITDVAVLVVAADDGVMPQTLEALDHARAANLPIVVAVNKVDKSNANPDRVKQQLSDLGVIPEEWGGNTVFVSVSAKQKTGLEDLLEMILLVADLAELKANPEKMARGTIIEAKLDRGKGPVATVLVQEGTFRVGDAFVAGQTYGRVRAFVNDRGERMEEAPPSFPVEIIGLSDVPEAGDTLQAVADDKIARQIAEARILHIREQTLASIQRVTLDDLYQQIKEGEIKDLNLILKADGQGSVEALKDALERLTTDEVRVRVIHTGVGTITESDVMLAFASNAIIIGYNIRPEPHIKNLAEREKVELKLYRVIYQAIEDIKQAMVGLRKPTYREVVTGRAEVLQVFKISKVGTVAGCRVTDGKISREADIRVIRDNAVVYEGKIASLKRFKDDAREVVSGYECGIGIEKFNDVKVGDVFEAYMVEEIRPTTLAGKVEG